MGKQSDQLARIDRLNKLIEKQTGQHVVRPYRADGYVNLLNKYGTQKDTTENYFFQPDPEIPDEYLASMYESNGLFSKIIDTPAEEAVKHGFKIKDLADQKIEKFIMSALGELNWNEEASFALKMNRLFGGALIVMLVNDGNDSLTAPLDWRNIESIDNLRVYERAVVQPDYSSIFTSNGGQQDPFHVRGSRLGRPEYYYVSSRYGSFAVHESRCLEFTNGRLPEFSARNEYEFWGVPEYLRMQRALRDTEVAHGNAVKMLERSIQAVYKMKDLSMILSADGGEDQVLKRLQIIDMARGLLNSMVIDSDGEDYDFRQFTFTGVAEVIDTTCNYLSALTSIPQTLLFGRSPAGMNATGESDLENYYNYVEKIQQRDVYGNLRYLLSVIFQAGINTREIDEIPEIDIEFEPLWSMSESEKVALDQQKAQIQSTKAQTASVYIDKQVVDPLEVRKKLADSDEFDIDTILDEVDEEDLFENAPSNKPQQPDPNDPMAAMMGGGAPASAPAPAPEEVSGQEKNTDPGAEGSTSTAAPAATKLPQDMSGEEKEKASGFKKEDYINAVREALKSIKHPEKFTKEDYIQAVKDGISLAEGRHEKPSRGAYIRAIREALSEADKKFSKEDYVKAVKEALAPKEEETHEDAEPEEEHGSVGVVVFKDGCFLCGRRDNDTSKGMICGPGGHIEPGETPEQAAIRETEEEFGITPTELMLIGDGPSEVESGLSPVIFLCTDYTGKLRPHDGEMVSPVFLSLEEIKAHEGQLFRPFIDGIDLVVDTIMKGYSSVTENKDEEGNSSEMSEKSLDFSSVCDTVTLRDYILQFAQKDGVHEDMGVKGMKWGAAKGRAKVSKDQNQ